METTAKVKQGESASPAKDRSTASQPKSTTEKVHDLKAEANEKVEQAKQVLSDAYDQTSKTLTTAYNHSIEYGRENPGKMALIAFGVGIGVGVLLANGSSRSRTSRIVPPVMNALSQIASEIFR